MPESMSTQQIIAGKILSQRLKGSVIDGVSFEHAPSFHIGQPYLYEFLSSSVEKDGHPIYEALKSFLTPLTCHF
jgi:hypothetical protein